MYFYQYIAAVVLLLISLSEAFTSGIDHSSMRHCSSSSQLFFQDDKTTISKPAPIKLIKGKKPFISKLKNLDDLKYFLQEDDRLAAIKFHAPWCKTCQRLGLNFKRFAMEMGDGIADRKMVEGQIRLAEVAYSPETHRFIQEQLQVGAVPTLQLYHGLNKLWEKSGSTNTKDLRAQVFSLDDLNRGELEEYADQADDGILHSLIEDSLYDYPDFLNEEW